MKVAKNPQESVETKVEGYCMQLYNNFIILVFLKSSQFQRCRYLLDCGANKR